MINRKRIWNAIYLTIGMSGVLFAIAVLSPSPSGPVVSTEFSPTTFRTRAVVQCMYLAVPLSPRWIGDEQDNSLSRYLAERGYLEPSPTDTRWDLVGASALRLRGWDGMAQYMCRYYDEPEASEWIRWSNSHPELADVYWPYVISLAREREYFSVLIMCSHPGREIDTAKKLQKAMDFAETSRTFRDEPTGCEAAPP